MKYLIAALLFSATTPLRAAALLDDLLHPQVPRIGIHAAAIRGNIAEVDKLLDTNPKLLEQIDFFKDDTPLLAAIKGLQVPMVRHLLARGAKIQAAGRHTQNGLHALAQGDPDSILGNSRTIEDKETAIEAIAKLCIAAGVDINQKDEMGNTPLMLAISPRNYYYYRAKVIETLLKLGADPTIVKDSSLDGAPISALDIAILRNQKDSAIVLLAANVPLNEFNIMRLSTHSELLVAALACHQLYNRHDITAMLTMPHPKTKLATQLEEILSLEQIEALQPIVQAEKNRIYSKPQYHVALLRGHMIENPVQLLQARKRGLPLRPLKPVQSSKEWMEKGGLENIESPQVAPKQPQSFSVFNYLGCTLF